MKVLFVCTGNICRSPLAARLWETQYPTMNVAAAGFVSREGRRSPDNVLAVAAARGISLVDHRSRTLDEAMLRESDLVVLFEPRQFVALRAAFPQYLDKVVMLGALLTPRKAFIDDPYQRSVAETEQIAAQVELALGELAKLLGLPHRSEVDEPMRPPAVSLPDYSSRRAG